MDYTKALTRQLSKSRGRKIILISEGVLGTFLTQNLKKMHVSVEQYIDISNSEREAFSLPEELAHKEKEYFIIAAIYSGHKRVAEECMGRGYSYNTDCVISSTSVYVDELDMVDPLLGYTRDAGVCPGTFMYGKLSGKNDLVILVLGNSSTDHSTAGLNSWPYYLFHYLSEKLEQNVVVYNAAVSGYHSGQEFLKLSRDGLDLNPTVVISFSGVTEVGGSVTTESGKKLVHKYQWRMWQNILMYDGAIPDSLHMRGLKKISTGTEERRTNTDIWINNERKMHALCEEFGIRFFGCLQPMISKSCVWDMEIEALLNDMGVGEEYYNAQKEFIVSAHRGMKSYNYMRDLTGVFEGRDKMYYDTMHYTEEGNQIIAKSVAELIVGELHVGYCRLEKDKRVEGV